MTQSEDADVRLHIINLREERQNLLTEAVAEYSETLARRLIEKITEGHRSQRLFARQTGFLSWQIRVFPKRAE